MGHKVNPRIFRIPLIREWESKWFTENRKFRQFLKEDIRVRKFLAGKFKNCAVSRMNMERTANTIRIIIHTAKPGLIIGRGGVDIEKIKKEIQSKYLERGTNLEINVVEEKSPMLSTAIILEGIIADLEKRVPYRKVLKKIIRQAKTSGAKGIKVIVGGRLGGVEIARQEKMTWGKLPLHTIRADIDYSRGTAFTLFGAIGVKVWIYKGEKF